MLVLEKISSRMLGFLSRVSRFKQGGPKFKQCAAPCFSNVMRIQLIYIYDYFSRIPDVWKITISMQIAK
jgi:hypothetical protein